MRRLAATAAVMAAIVSLVAAGPARAEDAVSISLALHAPVGPVHEGGTFVVSVVMDDLADAAEVTFSAYPAVDNLGSIGRIDPGDDALSRESVQVDGLRNDPDGGVSLSVPVVRDPDDAGLWIPAPGVYPVEVVVSAGATQRRLVTSLVDLGRPGAFAPLLVAPIVDVGTPVRIDSTGTPTVDAQGLDELAGELSSLAALGNQPATVVVSPVTVEVLDRVAQDTLERLVDLLAGRQVVSPPFVPIDLVAYAARGDRTELVTQLAAGNTTLGDLIETRLDTQSFVTDDQGLDAAVVDLLAEARINQLVLDERDLVDDPGAVLAFGSLVELDGVDDGPRAVVTVDHLLTAVLDELPAAEATTVFWARVALLLQGTRPRAVHGVALTERGLGAERFAEIATFLDAGPDVVQPVTLDDLFDRIDDDTAARRFEPTEPQDIAAQVDALAAARLRMAAISAMLPADDSRPEDFTSDLLIAADRRLEAADRSRLLTAVVEASDRMEACLELPQDEVSLFDRSATLRLSFGNRCDVPLTVIAKLASDRLGFPAGPRSGGRLPTETSITLVLPPGQKTVWEPEIRAITPGRIEMEIQLFTPTPTPIPIAAPSAFTVNVRTNSGIGVVISVVAGALLGGWWVLHLRKRWRARRSAPVQPAA